MVSYFKQSFSATGFFPSPTFSLPSRYCISGLVLGLLNPGVQDISEKRSREVKIRGAEGVKKRSKEVGGKSQRKRKIYGHKIKISKIVHDSNSRSFALDRKSINFG